MAQFDVHRNPGRRGESVPFVVTVQSAVFDGYRRRVVMPLVKKSHFGKVRHARLNPSFTVKGVGVILHPLEIVSVPAADLGKAIASLAARGDDIVGALDQLITRVYG